MATRCTYPVKGPAPTDEAECGHKAVALATDGGRYLPRCKRHSGSAVRRFIERYPESGWALVPVRR